jgi:hypothetical protein
MRWALLLCAAPTCFSGACFSTNKVEYKESTDSQPQTISAPTVNRHIPLRFVLMTQTGVEDVAPFNRLKTAVSRANLAFNQAGVNFYIRSIERYALPQFYNARADLTSSPLKVIQRKDNLSA